MTQLRKLGETTPELPLTPGILVGQYIFVSGQIARRPDGRPLTGDFDLEVAWAIDAVAAVLESGGSSLASVVKVNAYLSDASTFGRFNAVYAKRFPHNPARTTVVVSFGNPDVRVELDAIAFIDTDASTGGAL